MSAADQDAVGGRQGAVQAAEVRRAGELVLIDRELVQPLGGQGRQGAEQEKESKIRSLHLQNLSL